MPKLTLIQVGKPKEQFVKTGIDVFLPRIKNLEIIELKDSTKEKEATAIKQTLAKKQFDIIIALDEKGTEHTSHEFATFIKTNQDKAIAFIIGGPDGLDDQVKQEATQIWALSQLTFTHEMAQLFFIEQLYRAQSINDGKNYHKD